MGIFNASIFNNAIFNVGGDGPPPVPPDVVEKTGGGGIERGKRRSTFKPLGFVDRPRKKARKDIEDRIDDSVAIQAEVAQKLALEFTDENESLKARGEAEQDSIALKLAEDKRIAAVEKIQAAIRAKEKDDEDIIAITLLMIAAEEE